MWWAGVGWRDAGFEVAVVDAGGTPAVPAARFGAAALPDLVRLLAETAGRAPGGLAIAVDSTNGLVDGHLLAADLAVYRLDPPGRPDRPGFGSLPAVDLARLAATGPAPVHRLTTGSGALAGRAAEYAAHLARSAPVERELAAAGRYVERGDGTVPQVALTFDDGPHPVFTAQVLEVLARYRLPATFFCVGLHVTAHPDLVRRIVAAGHLVGNHTWSHPYLPDLTGDELRRQVDATAAALRAVAPPSGLVRPPYGGRTPEALRLLAGAGLTTVLWDVDVRDWAVPGTGAIVAEAARSVRAGSVILMHDAGGDRSQTVAALPRVIEDVLARGYRPVRLDELSLGPGPRAPDRPGSPR
jgi:peptidoglycan/xylan/chitin deacetylase (PgdA/CDA1 family)